jgi:predicted esterase
MNRKLLQPIIGLIVVIWVGAGCAAPAASLEPPTQTPVPPTATQAAQPAKPEEARARGELIHEKITSQALAGNLIGDPTARDYWIFLPPSYAEGTRRYPLVTVLHGFTGDENQLLPLATVYYDEMLQKGAAQEMILVFPDGRNKFGGSGYLSSPTIGDYETYIARELVAQVDANYRTIPERDSRGITGCSMGGDGAMHLALTFPDVYGVAAPMSATYDFANSPIIPATTAKFTHEPRGFDDYQQYFSYNSVADGSILIAAYISIAAGAAPNPDKPPFYLDMPFEVVDGQGRVVPEVWEKIAAVDEVHDLEDYLQQPVRLGHILLYHGALDDKAPVELARSFDRLLTGRGVEHEYVEVETGTHCGYDMTPVLQYLSDHLVGEQP